MFKVNKGDMETIVKNLLNNDNHDVFLKKNALNENWVTKTEYGKISL